MILTGVVSYNAVRSKLMSQGLEGSSADALIAYSFCAAYAVPTIKGFIAQYNPSLSGELSSNCVPLLSVSTPEAGEVGTIINAISTHPMPSFARSKFYYYYRGLTQYSNVTAGSAGGEQPNAPTVSVLPAGSQAEVDGLTKVINNLNRIVGV
jgi:hypothetical protein